MTRFSFWQDFCKYCDIGGPLKLPDTVRGGWLHRVYYLETSKGVFAVKELNSDWSQDKQWLEGFVRREQFAGSLAHAGMPAVAAIKLNGRVLVHYQQLVFVIYPWIEGQVLLPEQTGLKHMRALGQFLAEVHEYSLQHPDIHLPLAIELGSHCSTSFVEQWLDRHQHKQVADIVKASLCHIDQASSGLTVASHTDINPYNVVWQQGRPYVLDWELSASISPIQELLGVAIEWTGLIKGHWDSDCLTEVLSSYFARASSLQTVRDMENDSVKAVTGVVKSWADWLKFLLSNKSDQLQSDRGIAEAIQALYYISIWRGPITELIRTWSLYYR